MLGLVVSEMLYASFPGAEEGELSRRLADLVRRESCAEVARDRGEEVAVTAANTMAKNVRRPALPGCVPRNMAPAKQPSCISISAKTI